MRMPIWSYSDALRVIATVLALSFAAHTPARTQAANLPFDGGRVVINPFHVFLVYWLPSGVALDTNVSDGIGNFESLTQRFVQDLSGTDYLNIVTQYAGTCGGTRCVMQNVKGAVVLGGVWVDTQAYPHPNPVNATGTQGNPLQDSDIQNEVTRAIGQNNWSVDANSIVVVITGVFSGGVNNGKPVDECRGANCTFRGKSYCAYHTSFSSSGKTFLYAYLSDASFTPAGCSEGVSQGANGQLASDREVALLSHELFEAVTDPQANAWIDSASNEIGDLCNQQPAFVNLSFRPYDVQLQWSNAESRCAKNLKNKVVAVVPAIDYLLSGRQTSAAPVGYLLESQ